MSKKIKILIVDDNKELAQNLNDILSEENLNSVIVYDGNSAVKKCKEEDFQLAILDMKLPDYDGLNLTEELLNINKELEFIIITGYGTMETAIDAVKQKKIVAYETKPIDINRFIFLITQTVSRKIAELAKKRADEDLRLSEKRLRSIVETAPSFLMITDKDGKNIYVSPNCEKYTGYRQSELQNNFIWWVDKEDTSKAKEVFDRTFRDGIGGKDFEYKALKKNGESWYASSSWATLKDREGNFKGVVMQTVDITARKKVEERFRLAAEVATDLIYEWDIRNDSLEWFGDIDKSLGYEKGEIPRTIDGWVNLIHPDDRKKLSNSIEYHRKSTKPIHEEYRIRAKDGSWRYWIDRGAPVLDEKGKPYKWIGGCLDVTEKRQAEEELKRSLVELEHSNKELEQFTYVSSHDLQEPLRTVSSYVQLLSDRYKDKLDKNADEFIGFVTDAVDRMQRLIKGLLTLSRLEARDKKFELVDINIALENATNGLLSIIEKNNVQIINEKLPNIKADGIQIEQLLRNLIENAIKFRRKANPKINIDFKKNKSDYEFKVQDNGIGIDSQFSERIFTVFQRLHPRDKYPGTGIGLAICKKIVERHGGKIWVESEKGKGSTFYFTIPES